MRATYRKDNWQQAVVVSAILGILFSTALFNVLHARAFFLDTEFESTGLGEDGPYSEICGAQFDSYLLSSEKWKGRISSFANRLFKDLAKQALSHLICNLGLTDKTVGISFIIKGDFTFKTPRCTMKLNDVEASAVDAAERELTYDLLTRCTSTAMTDQIARDAIQIVQENGPNGGPTWQQDWHDVAPDAAQIGKLKARNTFANTNWCPEIQKEMEVLMNFDPVDAYPLDARTDSAGVEFTRDMSCRRDVPLSELEGDPTWVYRSALPQNDLGFAYLMANRHERALIAYEVQVARDELIAYGGFRGIRGSSPEDSCIRFVNGTCVEYDLIQVPGSVVRDNLFLANQAEYNIAISSDKMGEMMVDLRPRMSTLAQDLTTPVLALDYELDLATRRYQDAEPASIPTALPPDPTGDCGQPSQTQCTCHANPGDPDHEAAQALARDLVASAVGTTQLQNPQLFDANGKLPPSNFAPFVTQVCFTLGLSSAGCRPYTNRTPPADDVLIFPASLVEYAIDIIRADGTPRTAPTNKFSCITGVLP